MKPRVLLLSKRRPFQQGAWFGPHCSTPSDLYLVRVWGLFSSSVSQHLLHHSEARFPSAATEQAEVTNCRPGVFTVASKENAIWWLQWAMSDISLVLVGSKALGLPFLVALSPSCGQKCDTSSHCRWNYCQFTRNSFQFSSRVLGWLSKSRGATHQDADI